jgi:hypothetical protein
MSTLVAQTISNGTVSTSSENVIQGSAKAWVNFNGSGTVAIRGSFNVSSVTDNGTGQYTVNFTNAFADANYAAVISCGLYNSTSAFDGIFDNTRVFSTTSFRFHTVFAGGAGFDPPAVCASIFR